MNKNILPKLEKIAKGTDNLGRLANYLLTYDGDYQDLTVGKMCEDLYVSVASATRLSKKLGLNGFKELRVYLIQEQQLNSHEQSKYIDIDGITYLDEINNALNATINNLDSKQLERIAQKIIQADKTNCFAYGGSQVTISDFAYKLMRLKHVMTNFSDYHFQYIEAVNSNENTVALAISYSGNTAEVFKLLSESKKVGAYTVLITNNTLIKEEYIDEVVFVSGSENTHRLHSISSRAAILATLDLLYLKIINTDYDYYQEILEKSRIIK